MNLFKKVSIFFTLQGILQAKKLRASGSGTLARSRSTEIFLI